MNNDKHKEWQDTTKRLNKGTFRRGFWDACKPQTFKDNYKNGKNKVVKKVFCVELNKTFDCITSAQEELGIWGTSIGSACRGKTKTAGGFHWRYAND